MAGVEIMLDQDFKLDPDELAASFDVVTYLASRALSGIKVRPKLKQYNIRLKPIRSALKWDALGLTFLKSLHKFFHLLESGSPMKNFVVASLDAVKYIFFEVICVTTTRVLERLAILCLSPRIAWKLLRDVPALVIRMAGKGVRGFNFTFRAAKATFLGHFALICWILHNPFRRMHACLLRFLSYIILTGNAIGALASWLVQVGRHIIGFFVPEKSDPVVDTWERVWILGKEILGSTVACIISFIFACICAAIVALIFGSIGTWIGAFTLPCVLAWIAAKLFCSSMGLLIGFGVGDFAGNALVSLGLEKLGL